MPELIFDPPVIAHRGASAYAPENTMTAFALAAEMGIKWIEFDVMQAACNELIIFHDDTLKRTTNGRGRVRSQPYALLESLDAGKWFNPRFSGERIPSLKQVLDFLDLNSINANVEIKAIKRQENLQVMHLYNLVTPYFNKKNMTLLFSSFSWSALRILRDLSPDCLIGLLIHEWRRNWESVADDLDCVAIHVNERIMTKVAAEDIKKSGRKLLCYTVNDTDRALELFDWGVDAVFTDVPDRIMHVKSSAIY